MEHRMSVQDKHQHGEVALTCLTRHQKEGKKEEERLIFQTGCAAHITTLSWSGPV